MARRYVLKCSAVGAAVARVAVVLLASTWALLASAAEPKEKAPAQTGETSRWGYVGLANPADWALPQVTIAPASVIGKLPYGQVYATARQRVLHYRFPVPDGTYKVRVHFLQAVGGATKNEAGLSASANGVKIVDNQDVYAAREKAKELPSDVVAKTSEADVEGTGGKIMVSFPVTTKPNWAVCGLEVIGKQATIRVNCGAKAPCTDADGHVWESDWDRRLPLTSGEIALEKREMPKGEWVNISDEILRKFRDELGLVPVSVWPYFFAAKDGWVVCDRSGNTFVGYLGLGLWGYDLAAGRLTRADEGKYTAEPNSMGLSLNPNGPGFLLMGWSAQSKESFAVRCVDGTRFESIDGGAQHNGWDQYSVDWTADPPVVFVKVHHTEGMTKLSTDGGKTFKQIGDDGKNLSAVGALGDRVLVKWLRDGTIMRSTDLGGTWARSAEVKYVTKPRERGWINRIGKTAYFPSQDGLYVSRDAGVTWQLVPKSPAFTESLVPGKKEGHLVGFAADAAYESTDGGATWKKAVDKPRGGAVFMWSYDPVGDVFYAQTGSIFRYARQRTNHTNQEKGASGQ
jgi:hypothetical protein